MNYKAMAVASVKEKQQNQTFIVLKVLFHLSSPRASLPVHEGGKAGSVIFLQQMRQQAERGQEAYGHVANKKWDRPGKTPESPQHLV